MTIYDVIRQPVITEKTTRLMDEENKYTFEVALSATKSQVKHAFRQIFGIDPLSVNIIRINSQKYRSGTRHPGFTPNIKKAIVTLSAEQKLNLLGDEEEVETKPKKKTADVEKKTSEKVAKIPENIEKKEE